MCPSRFSSPNTQTKQVHMSKKHQKTPHEHGGVKEGTRARPAKVEFRREATAKMAAVHIPAQTGAQPGGRLRANTATLPFRRSGKGRHVPNTHEAKAGGVPATLTEQLHNPRRRRGQQLTMRGPATQPGHTEGRRSRSRT